MRATGTRHAKRRWSREGQSGIYRSPQDLAATTDGSNRTPQGLNLGHVLSIQMHVIAVLPIPELQAFHICCTVQRQRDLLTPAQIQRYSKCTARTPVPRAGVLPERCPRGKWFSSCKAACLLLTRAASYVCLFSIFIHPMCGAALAARLSAGARLLTTSGAETFQQAAHTRNSRYLTKTHIIFCN
jgi:hypothetical protein